MKNHKKELLIWVPFVVASVATVVAHNTLWATDWYRGYLAAFGVLCCVLGVVVLAKTGTRRWSIAGVIVGLLIGQWWLIQILILAISWRVAGFSP